ncbi:MAG: hypothetical protein Q7T11_01625 [Deltaproteobacteria bacterium]|nr:hypothetical protein [Deltaproteobacteria bacterium]
MAIPIGKTTSIVFRTLPFIVLRFFVSLFFALMGLFYLGILYVIGQGVAPLHEYARPAVWIIGVLSSFPLVRLAKEYLLYLVKAAHIAVIAELATKGSLPDGASQIGWGRTQVTARFKGASALFVVDRLVAGVIRVINGMMWQIGNIFGAIPGVKGLISLFNVILRFSLTYVDESILARNFLKPNETVWESARTGLVLYAQSWREILVTSIFLAVGAVVFLPVVFVLLLGPALGLAEVYPSLKIGFIAGAAFFTFTIKTAFFDPWTLTAMILTYLKATEGKQADPQWEAKLESVSKKFKKLKAKSLENPTPTPAQA